MRNRRCGSQWITCLALAATCSIVLTGCVQTKPPVVTRSDVEHAIKQGKLPEGARVTVLLPPAHLTKPQSERAVSDMRNAVVDGHKSTPSWLTVKPDGSFEATGYFSGDSGTSQSWNGRVSSFVTLQVPENVGGLDIIHAVPLMVFDDTRVMLNGKRVKFSSLTSFEGQSPISIGDYWVEAAFSVQDGWIRADSITYTGRELTWGAWPDAYPANATTDEWRLSQDASMAAGPGDSWLDISGAEGPVTLRGYQGGGVTSDPPENGFVSSVDLTVPDRLGPAAIYHVVQVFFTDSRLMPQQPDPDASLRSTFPTTKLKVRLDEGKLVAVGG